MITVLVVVVMVVMLVMVVMVLMLVMVVMVVMVVMLVMLVMLLMVLLLVMVLMLRNCGMVTSAERRLVIPQWREAVTRVEKSSDQATSLPMDNSFASGDDYAGGAFL